jgi:ATP-dependent DNA helicase Rep
MPFPNQVQQFVIEHRGRPLVVVAGPGTGKTHTLVERMICLLSEDPNREVSFITFTRMSRRDTREKIETVLGASVLEETVFAFPRTSTLHTYAKSLVHHYAAGIGRRSDFSVLIKEKGEIDLLVDELVSDLDLQLDTRLICEGIRYFRSTNKWSEGFPATSSERDQILQHFEFLLRFYNTFDIEGLVVSACRILQDFADVPPLYLQVDEYQDLNPNDQQLVRLTASHPSSRVVVVGDDAQSIYGSLRHANYQGIRKLWESPEWEHVSFSDCHRLPIHVQNAAQALIENEGYLGKLNPCQDSSRKILTFQCTTYNVQMEAVGKMIMDLKSNGQNQEGQPLLYKDFIVLCPAAKFVNRITTVLQNQFGIPTKQQATDPIPNDYWRLLLVLRMLHSEDSLALRQWLSLSGLRKREVANIRCGAMQNDESLYSYCSKLSDQRIREIYVALYRLRDNRDNFTNFCRVLAEFPNLSIQEQVLLDMMQRIEGATRETVAIDSIIRSIYERFGLLGTESESDMPGDDKALVTTLHRAKGLESEYVFVTWMNSEYMPMPNRDAHEERRVLYVALTRARQDVILTFYEVFREHRRLREEAISPFLQEIIDYLDIRRVNKKDVCNM